MSEALLARLEAFVGREAEPVRARDPVNRPMIRHWCDALGDRNPVYTDPALAARSRHGGIVAPPAMLQAWTMRGLQPEEERAGRTPGPQAEMFRLLDAAGFTSVVATDCEQAYARYLVPGDVLTVTTGIASVSPEKRTALGAGHFLTQRMRYTDERGEEVATMRFRLLRFRPRAQAGGGAGAKVRRRPRPATTRDSAFFWEGIQQGRLLIQRCAACQRLRHPPGPMCPGCHSLDWDAVEATGRGRVYSFAVMHHPPVPPFSYPNAIALVELEEGTRVVANLVGIDPADIRIGLPVRASIEELEEGRRFLQFRPEGAVAAAEAAEPAARPLAPGEVAVGGALPPLALPITPTLIIAGALSSRDYQDVHHDRDLARARGSRDIFMNILTTNGLVGRFVTDWAGPEARLLGIDIRLGAPNYPGDTMTLEGRVESLDGGIATVSVTGCNGIGEHVSGRVVLELAP